jgi:hypothetical protein
MAAGRDHETREKRHCAADGCQTDQSLAGKTVVSRNARIGICDGRKIGCFAIITNPIPAGAHCSGSPIPIGDELGLETVAYCPSHLTPISAEVEHS